jgi:hypothetical protein
MEERVLLGIVGYLWVSLGIFGYRWVSLGIVESRRGW